MKRIFRLIGLAAILCVVYLALTTPRADTDDITDQMKTAGQSAVRQADELIDNAVERADKVIDNAVAQADEAISDAVESAAEGAKQGFLESLKKSAGDFWKNVFGDSAYTDKQQ